MRRLFALVTLLALSTPSVLAGSSCIAFDTAWNLLAFNLNGKDYNAGISSTWASGTATDITATGRPPFNGNSTKCYLAEFFNAIYVLGADTSNPTDVYIYDATGKSWSQQKVTAPSGFDPNNFQAILDHDTNDFYALSGGELYALTMNSLAAAQSSSLAWSDQEAAEITTTNYNPVMAIAQNHIFFFGVPNTPAGSLNIFVIHFAFWQPDAQPFNGTQFPDTHGQATSFFLDSVVQENIAFIPDDGSQTYILNVQFNTTNTMPAPPLVDASATYFASETELVQLASSGAVSWIPFNPSDAAANAAAKWSSVQSLAGVAPPSGSSGSSGSGGGASASGKAGGATQSGGSAATGGSPSSSGSGSAASPSGSSTAKHDAVVWGSGLAMSLAGVAVALL